MIRQRRHEARLSVCVALANADANFSRSKYLHAAPRGLPVVLFAGSEREVDAVIAISTLHSNHSATEIKILANIAAWR